MKPLFITIGLFLVLTGVSFAIGPKLLEKKRNRQPGAGTPVDTGTGAGVGSATPAVTAPSSTNPPAGNNSWISSDGKCPAGYRTSYQTVQCINAPCPAQTICTKDALLSQLGGFGSFANLYGFSNTYTYLKN